MPDFCTIHPRLVDSASPDLCNGSNGELRIPPSGILTFDAEGGTFSNAQCFTSLDGVFFDS
jgi:hypothetical protein